MEDTVIRTHDTVFKYIFGRPETKDALLGFVNAVVCSGEDKEKICDLELVYRKPEFHMIDYRISRVCLRAVTSSGKAVDIEILNFVHPESKINYFYYFSDSYHSQIEENETEQESVPLYVINIVHFDLCDWSSKYIHKTHIYEDTGEPDAGQMTIFFLVLPKWVALKRKAQTELERWLAFLSQGDSAEIEEYAMLDPSLGKALEAEKQLLLTQMK